MHVGRYIRDLGPVQHLVTPEGRHLGDPGVLMAGVDADAHGLGDLLDFAAPEPIVIRQVWDNWRGLFRPPHGRRRNCRRRAGGRSSGRSSSVFSSAWISSKLDVSMAFIQAARSAWAERKILLHDLALVGVKEALGVGRAAAARSASATTRAAPRHA